MQNHEISYPGHISCPLCNQETFEGRIFPPMCRACSIYCEQSYSPYKEVWKVLGPNWRWYDRNGWNYGPNKYTQEQLDRIMKLKAFL